MSELYFISDLHIGHKKIMEFAGDHRKGDSWQENIEYIVDDWNKIVSKRDNVVICGDVVFGRENLYHLSRLNGVKELVKGNHDKFQLSDYSKYFKNIHGVYSKGGHWATHIPIVESELRNRINIHGHTHFNRYVGGISEHNKCKYVNVCIEIVKQPYPFEKIKNGDYFKEFV